MTFTEKHFSVKVIFYIVRYMSMSNNKHIAQSGKKQGQWVNCTAAPGKCNFTSHISNETLHAAQMWLKADKNQNKNLTEITKEDIDLFDFEQGKSSVWYNYYRLKQLENARKSERHLPFSERKYGNQPKQNAPAAPKPELVMQYPSIKLNQRDYNNLKADCERLGVKMSFDSASSSAYGSGKYVESIKNLKFAGSKENVDKALAFADAYKSRTLTNLGYTQVRMTKRVWDEINGFAANHGVRISFKRGASTSLFGLAKTYHFSELDFTGPAKETKHLANWFESISKG